MTNQEFIEINGGRPLWGSVCVQGSKNAILPMLAAALLPEKGCSVIRNVPPLNDILVAFEIMRYVGATVDYFPSEKVVSVDATHLNRSDLPESLTCRLRASVLFIPPLLARLDQIIAIKGAEWLRAMGFESFPIPFIVAFIVLIIIIKRFLYICGPHEVLVFAGADNDDFR